MAEQGKNNKIHYRTVIPHLNIVNKRTDFLSIKNVFKTVQKLFNNVKRNKKDLLKSTANLQSEKI